MSPCCPLIITSASETKLNVGYTLNSTYKGELWELSLYSGRAPSISAGNSGSSIGQYVGAGALYWLSRRTSAYVTGSFSQFSQTGNNKNNNGNNSNIYSLAYGGGINHRLTRDISVFAQFVRFQTNSLGVSGNSSDTLILGVRFAPEPWIWTF